MGTTSELMRSSQSNISKSARLIVASLVMAACTTTTDLVPVNSITLQPQRDSVEVGQTFSSWLVTLADINGITLTGRPLSWESSNPPAATVDPSSGLVTGVAEGITHITVRSGGKQAISEMKVLSPILSIVATPDSFDLPLNTSRTIAVQLVGPNGVAITNRVITWSSSIPNVAVVSAVGTVTAVNLGTTTITIRAGTKERTVRVRVVGEPVTSVRITPIQAVHIVRLGQAKQLAAECLNSSNQVLTGRSISWTSGNPVVATVSQNGLVSGAALGSAQITATCDNAVSGSTQVQVTLVPVVSVSIEPTSLTLGPNSQGQLTPIPRDSANNVLSIQGRNVNWTSSNNPIAVVNGQGVVQSGGQAGSANIQVSVDGVVSAPITVTVTAFFETASRGQRSAISDQLTSLSNLRRAPRVTSLITNH